jgi:sensor histidine kinase YesM
MHMGAVAAGLFERDALSFLVSLGTPFFSTMIYYWLMCRLLPNRMNRYALIAVSLVFALWSDMKTSVVFGTSYHLWMNIFINVWTCFILIYFFQGKFWRRLIVYWYFAMIHVVCEAISLAPIFLYHVYRGYRGGWSEMILSVQSDALLELLYMCAVVPLFLLLGAVSLKIWRRLFLQAMQPFYLLLIILPIGQRYALANVIHPSTGDVFLGIAVYLGADVSSSYYVLSLFGIAVSLIVSAVLFFYILSHEKRTVMEAELREAKRVMELEQVRYREIEKQSDELAKIRHDFNNQLASVIQLVKAGEGQTAQELIAALSAEIQRT